MSDIALRLAQPQDINDLLPLVAAYHAFEGLNTTAPARREAVARLLGDSSLGAIWCLERADGLIGYLAICYGFSIEFGGRDGFVDEFFVAPDARGRGLGGHCLETVKARAAADGIKALHLEVDRGNDPARRLYARHGFAARTGFHLMSVRLTQSHDDV